jgi:hypothetical protein
MKSAYERALERLEQEQGPARTLTDAQRGRISELETVYAARIAEKRLDYDSRIATAAPQDAAALQEEMASALQALHAELDAKKEAVWNEGP